MSFAQDLRDEFQARMNEWARVHRAATWAAANGDAHAAWGSITLLEGAAVCPVDHGPGAGELWLVVGGARVLGAIWAHDSTIGAVRVDWVGFDPFTDTSGRLDGGRFEDPGFGVQN